MTSTYGGDFSAAGLNVDQLQAPAVCQLSTAIQDEFKTAGQALSGCTNGAPDPLKEVPFNNNVIPSSLLDKNAQALLTAGGQYGGIFPAPTTGNTFIGENNLPTNVREEIVRIDENVSEKFTLFGHLVADQVSQDYGTNIYSADNVPTTGIRFGNPAYAVVLHAVYVINPSLVNEAALNYNGNRFSLVPLGLVSAPSDFTFNRFFYGPNVENRIPTIILGGSTGSSYSINFCPWYNSANDYQLRDDVSWTKGRHQFKMGGSWMLYQKVQDWFNATQGAFGFNGFYTGNDFADYLLGYATNYNEAAVEGTAEWNQDQVRTVRRMI